MVPRFLLHDTTDMSIGGISGKRKLSLWGGMLEGYHRSQEALCILESLLCRGGPLQRFGQPLQEISQRAQHLCAIGQKQWQKFTMPRKRCSCLMSWGRGKIRFWQRDLPWGAYPVTEIVWPRISKEGPAKTHFLRLMAKPLLARALKKASKWRSCVCLSGEPTCEPSMYANTPSRLSVVWSIIRWKVCAAIDSPNGMNKCSNMPSGMIIAIFGMSAAATGIWW